MEPEVLFRALLRRVRSGDPQAAAELVRQFEPAVRRAVRLRLTDPRFCRLQRILDSVDICQSVLGNFFVRAALGQFELETPDDLVALLVTMAYRKLIDQARKPANRLAVRGGEPTPETIADAGGTPCEVAAERELLQEFLRRLTPEERRLADLRAGGLGWNDVAAQVGGTSEGVRKQLERAIRRVAGQLGLEGDGDA
jgi:RNA polymerase sigma factor (sigma-70 family)